MTGIYVTVEIKNNFKIVEINKHSSFENVTPELILFDFDLNYGVTLNIKDEWMHYQRDIFTIVKNVGKKILYTEFDRNCDWDCSILSFINLIRLLPPSPLGRTKFNRMTDEQAINQLIVFKPEGLTNEDYLCEAKSRAPYIVAVGATKADITQYLIVLDGNLIPLPSRFCFIDVLDIVFKLHFIFHLKYDNNLRLFWMFLQKYIYKIDINNIPITLVDLYLKFEKIEKKDNILKLFV